MSEIKSDSAQFIQIIDRVYEIINEIIPALNEVGIDFQQQEIIDELSVNMLDCFFGNTYNPN